MKRTLLLPLGLVALAACAPQPPPPAQQAATPVGAEAYREILLREAELDWTADQLARVARGEARFVRARMDRLAAQLDGDGEDGGGDGLAAFARLTHDHPPSAAAVLSVYRRAVEDARRFVAERELVTIPPGPPLQVVETPLLFSSGRYPLVAYLGDKLAVTAVVGASPAALLQHCRVCVPPLVAHEAYPGHHVAFLVRRQPKPDPGAALRAVANAHAKNRFHSEGWGQYAEVLMLEAGFYRGDPARELAAWRLILVRLYRAALDAELHAGRIDERELVRALIDETAVAPATAEAELALHLEEPTMKASYAVGLLQILALREELGRRQPGFDRRAFHDRLLAWPLPWPEVARHFFEIEDLRPAEDGKALARLFGSGEPDSL